MIDNAIHTIPSIVTSYASKFGCNHAEFITSNADGDVYALSSQDEFGNILPIGLPIFILLKEGKISIIEGPKALKYQRKLSLGD